MKLFWTGTDSLMLVDYSMRKPSKRIYWWLFRRIIRLIEPFIQCHYCVSENVSDHLKKFGINKSIEIHHDFHQIFKTIKKIPHDEFIVLYYLPTGLDTDFIHWLYGADIVLQIENYFKDKIRLLLISGSQDMYELYPMIDFYLRPNRHDGHPRMIDECEQWGIPYYWSQTDPDIWDAIKAIEKAMNKQN